MEKKYCRVGEAAAYLSVGKSTILYWVHIGKLRKFIISPRVTVFLIEDLDKLVNNIAVGQSDD